MVLENALETIVNFFLVCRNSNGLCPSIKKLLPLSLMEMAMMRGRIIYDYTCITSKHLKTENS